MSLGVFRVVPWCFSSNLASSSSCREGAAGPSGGRNTSPEGVKTGRDVVKTSKNALKWWQKLDSKRLGLLIISGHKNDKNGPQNGPKIDKIKSALLIRNAKRRFTLYAVACVLLVC